MSIIVEDILELINSFASFESQDDWDNSGLLIGDKNSSVRKILVTLDVTEECLDYAINNDINLIVSHHPVIFSPIKQLSSDTIYYRAIMNEVNIISCHTPYDKADCGINYVLANRLKLKNIKRENDYIFSGELENEMVVKEFAKFAKDTLNTQGIRFVCPNNVIKKIAVCGGSGAEFIDEVSSICDCYLTGDLKYHDMLDASQKHFPVISAGHYETEYESFVTIADLIKDKFSYIKVEVFNQENSVFSI